MMHSLSTIGTSMIRWLARLPTAMPWAIMTPRTGLFGNVWVMAPNGVLRDPGGVTQKSP